jgi:hypothetical protein
VPRWLKLALIACLAVFVLIQLVPKRVSNAAVRAEPPWDSPTTRQLAVTACFNCHSNTAHLAWFEHVAPLSWWIAGHVDEGRHGLNFSEYDPNHHQSGERIAHEVQEGKMPPAFYTWFRQHGEAKLPAADRDTLIKGLTATFGPAVGVQERRGPGGD